MNILVTGGAGYIGTVMLHGNGRQRPQAAGHIAPAVCTETAMIERCRQ